LKWINLPVYSNTSFGFLVILLICVLTPSAGNAQTNPVVEGSDIRPFTINGSVGFISEGYAVNGIEARRPAATAQVFANTSFSIFGFRSGLNLRYSTESSKLRQSMNQFNFHGTWKWITLSAGTVSPSFSRFGLSGTTIDGGLLELNPGKWIFSFTGGRSNRAVQPSAKSGFRQAAYEQWLYAGKVGYGKSGGPHFHLSVMYASDDTTSLDNPVNVKPAQNLNITPDFGIALFHNVLKIQGLATISAFTRDLKAPTVPTDNTPIPAFATSIFTPHIGSRVDYATDLSGDLNLDVFRMKVNYQRIQPGFASLGISRIRSDQEQIRVQPQAFLLNRKLRVGLKLAQTRDNLLQNRISTQLRRQAGVNIQSQLSKMLLLNTTYSYMINHTKPENDSPEAQALEQKQMSNSIMVQPTYTLLVGQTAHSISLAGSYETLTNKYPGSSSSSGQSNNFTNINTTLNYSVSLPSGLMLNASGNYLISDAGATKTSNVGLNFGTGYSFFEQKLMVNLNIGLSQNNIDRKQLGQSADTTAASTSVVAQQGNVNLSATYRLPNSDNIRLTIRNNNNNQVKGQGNSFQELQARLQYQHQF